LPVVHRRVRARIGQTDARYRGAGRSGCHLPWPLLPVFRTRAPGVGFGCLDEAGCHPKEQGPCPRSDPALCDV